MKDLLQAQSAINIPSDILHLNGFCFQSEVVAYAIPFDLRWTGARNDNGPTNVTSGCLTRFLSIAARHSNSQSEGFVTVRFAILKVCFGKLMAHTSIMDAVLFQTHLHVCYQLTHCIANGRT